MRYKQVGLGLRCLQIWSAGRLQVGHEFDLHMHYHALGAAHTRLRWCMQFPDAGEADRVRALVIQANEQNFDRLEAVLGLPSGRAPHGTRYS